MNARKMFGPSETWSAQVEDFIYFVSKNTIEKKFNYENLKEEILNFHPGIMNRLYISFGE